ncbi:hypothetical protein ACMXYX_01085 [Neptuniibacter sp. QD72_48]|uniref:hypothetical protein n=1 Tax=Neptuniibacter sp. QD72_48 TaxID=3398214 RepID=UPI0039F5EE0E
MTEQRAKDPIKPTVIALALSVGMFFTTIFFLPNIYWVWVIILLLSSYLSVLACKEEYVGFQQAFGWWCQVGSWGFCLRYVWRQVW